MDLTTGIKVLPQDLKFIYPSDGNLVKALSKYLSLFVKGEHTKVDAKQLKMYVALIFWTSHVCSVDDMVMYKKDRPRFDLDQFIQFCNCIECKSLKDFGWTKKDFSVINNAATEHFKNDIEYDYIIKFDMKKLQQLLLGGRTLYKVSHMIRVTPDRTERLHLMYYKHLYSAIEAFGVRHTMSGVNDAKDDKPYTLCLIVSSPETPLKTSGITKAFNVCYFREVTKDIKIKDMIYIPLDTLAYINAGVNSLLDNLSYFGFVKRYPSKSYWQFIHDYAFTYYLFNMLYMMNANLVNTSMKKLDVLWKAYQKSDSFPYDDLSMALLSKAILARGAKQEKENQDRLKAIYATAFMTKITNTKKAEKVANESNFAKVFPKVELDGSSAGGVKLDYAKFAKVNDLFPKIYQLMPKVIKGREPYLRFRRLGNYNAIGLYFYFVNCICVDIRDTSSFVHEYGHYLDYVKYHSLSMTPVFAQIMASYTQTLHSLGKNKIKPNKMRYYCTPTEIFARGFEYYTWMIYGNKVEGLAEFCGGVSGKRFKQPEYLPFKKMLADDTLKPVYVNLYKMVLGK